MKIKNYKKIKNDCYKICFEDSSKEIILYDAIILKYNLLLKKEISTKELAQMQKENEKYLCYVKAIKYLNYKNRSKKEIREFLKKQEFSLEDIENTIKKLEEENFIKEEEYIKMFVHDQLLLTNNGPKKIFRKLIELGFSEEKIKSYLVSISKEEWQKKLEHLISKKINANKKDGSRKMKEKILYSCIKDGFLKEDIIEILDKKELPKNDSALLKESQKLYKKLSIKYNDKELWYQLKGRLLNKGFSYEEIDEALESIKKASL